MKNSEIKETLITYIENKILFDKINGLCSIISLKDKHFVTYTDNSTGNKKQIILSTNELLKYYRVLKHK